VTWRSAAKAFCLATAIPAMAGPPAAVSSSASSSPSPDEARLVRLINRERAEARLGLLAWDHALAGLARLHAADMRSMEKVTHHSGADDADFATRLARTEYRASHAAENVALDMDLSRAHAALMKSPGHRANILNPSLTAVGVGIVRARDGAAYIVEDFATPLARISDREAADMVRDAVTREHRAGNGPRKVSVLEEDRALSRELLAAVRSMVEQDSVTPRKGWGFEAGWVFTYTSADPAKLPLDAARKVSGARTYAVAVTFSKSRSYPFGTWWVVVALKR